jgi:hypothetical protein
MIRQVSIIGLTAHAAFGGMGTGSSNISSAQRSHNRDRTLGAEHSIHNRHQAPQPVFPVQNHQQALKIAFPVSVKHVALRANEASLQNAANVAPSEKNGIDSQLTFKKVAYGDTVALIQNTRVFLLKLIDAIKYLNDLPKDGTYADYHKADFDSIIYLIFLIAVSMGALLGCLCIILLFYPTINTNIIIEDTPPPHENGPLPSANQLPAPSNVLPDQPGSFSNSPHHDDGISIDTPPPHENGLLPSANQLPAPSNVLPDQPGSFSNNPHHDDGIYIDIPDDLRELWTGVSDNQLLDGRRDSQPDAELSNRGLQSPDPIEFESSSSQVVRTYPLTQFSRRRGF